MAVCCFCYLYLQNLHFMAYFFKEFQTIFKFFLATVRKHSKNSNECQLWRLKNCQKRQFGILFRPRKIVDKTGTYYINGFFDVKQLTKIDNNGVFFAGVQRKIDQKFHLGCLFCKEKIAKKRQKRYLFEIFQTVTMKTPQEPCF